MDRSARFHLLERSDGTRSGRCLRLADVYTAYAPRCFGTASLILGGSTDADDVVQRVFLKIPDRVLFQTDKHMLSRYLRKAARNEALSICRARRRERTLTHEYTRVASSTPQPDAEASRSEIRHAVQEC